MTEIERGLRLLSEGLGNFLNKSIPGTATADVYKLLRLFLDGWSEFRAKLDRMALTLAHELLDTRNKWAHQSFDDEDTFRALDSIERFLKLLGESEVKNKVTQLKAELGKPSDLPPLHRQPRIYRFDPNKGNSYKAKDTRLLREIAFSLPSSSTYNDLGDRLESITSQVYGTIDTKTGLIPRVYIPLDFDWVNEARIEAVKTEGTEYLQVVLHIGDTKGQGEHFFSVNPGKVDWPDHILEYQLEVKPFIKIANPHASALMWIRPTEVESLKTHTKGFFDSFAGRVRREEWSDFEQRLSDYIEGWRSKCFVHDGYEEVSWDKKIANTKYSYFLLSVGINLRVSIPYRICQDLDNSIDNSPLATKCREIVEEIKNEVEKPVRAGYQRHYEI